MFGQNCSKPAWHEGQVPSESTMQPTVTRSPDLNLVTAAANLGDAADDLMTGDDGVDGRHEAGKFVPDMVEIGVADTAEQDVDLNVVRGWIAPHDRGGGKQRYRTRSGVSFGVIHIIYPPIIFIWALNPPWYC